MARSRRWRRLKRPARQSRRPTTSAATGVASHSESDRDFEARATQVNAVPSAAGDAVASTPPGAAGEPPPAGPLEAIALYDRLLAEYPDYEHNDRVIYQKARAYDELGRTEEAMETMELFVKAYQHSMHYDEVQFRRAEFFFTRRKFRDAESAYQSIIAMGAVLVVLRAGALQAGLDALQAGVLRGSAAPVHRASRLQGLDRLRLRAGARRGRGTANRGHLPRHQPGLLEPRRP